MLRRVGVILAAGALTALVASGLALAKGHGSQGHGHKAPSVCSGTQQSPGVLTGVYKHGVVVRGACEVNSGPATVDGKLVLRRGSLLVAAFGQNSSSLTVKGSVLVRRGATFVLGCNTTSSPCIDDPNQNAPTLSSTGKITGNLTESAPLGVIIHSSTIGGNVTQVGGGGGLSCTPPTTGPFSLFMSPVFSTYEDASVHGNLEVKGIKSCWLGVNRVDVHGNLLVLHNKMGDPDAIEILSDNVHKNLVCRNNGHPSGMPPGTQPVWDSADTGSDLYPRQAEPNTVHGHRIGQCKLASPATQGGPLGPGPF